MTPPTIQEFAGIFMLALVTAGLITHTSTGTHAAPMRVAIADNLDVATIDGIETIALPATRGAGRAEIIRRVELRANPSSVDLLSRLLKRPWPARTRASSSRRESCGRFPAW